MTSIDRNASIPTGRVDDGGDGVLVARDFHLGSVIHISTEEGPVIVDTTGGLGNAAAARDALAARAPGRARWIVYTHCHPDHCGGAGAFESDDLAGILAQDQLPDLWERDMDCLWPWHERVRSWQRGRPMEVGLGYDEAGGRGFLDPTLTFRDDLELEIGGTRLHLEHTEGETRDHLLVWLPDRKVLCPGDLYYAAFPNLSTPAIGPRPIEGWIRSLDRMLELDADHLAAQPFLQELYGTVAWGVRASYDRLTGWFDGSPATTRGVTNSRWSWPPSCSTATPTIPAPTR